MFGQVGDTMRIAYIAGTTVVAGIIGALFGLMWGFFAQEAGWWGAWMLFGIIIGPVLGIVVAERATT
jgi:uncharacterized protein YqgC (DUF456 family)